MTAKNKPSLLLVVLFSVACLFLVTGDNARAGLVGTDLVKNGNFEEWKADKLRGWGLYDNASAERVYIKETQDIFSGKAAVKVYLGGKLPRGVFVAVSRGIKDLENGESATISVYIKGNPGGDNEKASLSVFKSVPGRFEKVKIVEKKLTGEWQNLKFDFLKDWDGQVIVYAGGTIASGEIVIDNCQCVMKGAKFPAVLPPQPAEEEVPLHERFPYLLSVHTPVDLNLFLPTEPLEFNVLIYGKGTPPKIGKGVELYYEVTDYQRFLIDDGIYPLPPFFNYNWREKGKDKEGIFKILCLGDKVRAEEGRWMALKVELRKGNEVLARNETSFAVLNPQLDYTDKDVLESRILNGNLGGKFRSVDSLYGFGMKKKQNPWNMETHPSWREMVNMHGMTNLGWESKWKEMQPTRESPIDFSGEPDIPEQHGASNRVFSWEERIPGWRFFIYTQGQKSVPDWAWIKDKNGKRTIDPEAYARYTREFVKHSNVTHYIVTSIEGPDATDFPEMTIAAAKAVKSVDKRLKVGAGADFFMRDKRELARQLDEQGVVDAVDFFCYDVYMGNISEAVEKFTNGIKVFKEELAKVNKPRDVWLTEYGNRTDRDQIGRARRVVEYYLSTLAGGVDKLRWFPCPAPPWSLEEYDFGPDIRGSYEGPYYIMCTGGWRYEGEGPRVCPGLMQQERAWYPFLQLITIYHLNRLFQYTYNDREVVIDKDSKAYLFDTDEGSVMGLWRKTGTGSRHCILSCRNTPFELTDLYGRTFDIKPFDGKAILTLAEDPVLLKFAENLKDVKLEEAPIRIEGADSGFPVGSSKNIEVKLTNPFSKKWEGSFQFQAGPRWKTGRKVKISLSPGESRAYTISITVPEGIPSGDYPLFGHFLAGNRKLGLTVDTLRVKSESK